MRGSLLAKKDLISHTRPSDNAPESIKNMSTPILLDPKKQLIIHEIVGAETNSFEAIPLVHVNMWNTITEIIAKALRASK